MKKVAIILNGISLKKKFFYKKILPALEKICQAQVFETQTKSDGVSLASKAVDKQFDILLAAGGDGTIHQVVNGMLQGRENEVNLPALGVVPLGSGNDLARALKIRCDAKELSSRIISEPHQKIDVGKIIFRGVVGKEEIRYFINVADVGMGPEVVSRMLDSDRAFGSAMAYYSAIVATFFSYKPVIVKIKTSAWEWENKLRTLAIGNGKYYGHGLCIAPDAKPDDGIFSTFICGAVSVLEFIWYSGALKSAKKISHPEVEYSTATYLEVTSQSACRIEADGELVGHLPATVSIIPSKINFLF